MITYFVAALAMIVHKSNTNRAAVFLFAVFYSFAEIIALDQSANYFMWCIISTTCFICALSKLSRATILVVLLASTEIILVIIDLTALVSYNLNNDWLYQSHFKLTYYVAIAQIACLLVTDGRSVNIRTIRYNISLSIHRAHSFLFHRAKIHHSKR